jgi:GTP-binding protein
MFIDEAKITVRSGKGGNGMMHFRREKYITRGGPDGGDGGKGGDVVLVVSEHLNTLYPFRNQRLFRADDGKRGNLQKQTGRSGEDLIVRVPPGTIVYDDATNDVVGDLVEEGQRLVVAKGGRAGRGNVHFASSRNKAPRIAEKGAPCQERELRLELKLIADVGIVGVPNAGKSTFLSVVTNAKPKIASYPFTTIQPNLGVAELDDHKTLVLADIPGLIEGAHQGVGLGFEFLRHVQRTRVLIHLIDGTSDDPIADLSQINSELALYDDDLGNKPQVVALNKMDLPDVQEKWPALEKELKKRGFEPMAISAIARTNVRKLLYKAAELLAATPKPEKAIEIAVYRPEADPNDFEIIKEAGGTRVKGISIERAAAMTYWEYTESVRRFQNIMEVIGIDQALRDAGVEAGDTVFIGEFELEWEN